MTIQSQVYKVNIIVTRACFLVVKEGIVATVNDSQMGLKEKKQRSP